MSNEWYWIELESYIIQKLTLIYLLLVETQGIKESQNN